MNTFDGELFTDTFYEDPYPVYEQIRREGEIVWSNAHDAWLVATHQQVVSGLTDPRLSRSLTTRTCPGHATGPEELSPGARLDAVVGSMMMFTDPPQHSRLREALKSSFTPRVVQRLRSKIEEVTDELLLSARKGGQWDVIGELAFPLPLIVLCELLGFPPKDRMRLKRWSDDIIEYTAGYQVGENSRQRAVSSLEEFEAYFEDHLQDASFRMDEYLAAFTADTPGFHRELVANVLLLLINGHETTTFQIGNAVLSLIRNPYARDFLLDHPERWPKAVEEFLRFDSAVQMRGVTAAENFSWAGADIARGQRVLLLIGSANRDPRVFRRPDRLTFTGSGGRHLSFGFGIHYCLGAALARAEIEIAVRALFQRYPTLKLLPKKLVWHELAAFRGLERLVVDL